MKFYVILVFLVMGSRALFAKGIAHPKCRGPLVAVAHHNVPTVSPVPAATPFPFQQTMSAAAEIGLLDVETVPFNNFFAEGGSGKPIMIHNHDITGGLYVLVDTLP